MENETSILQTALEQFVKSNSWLFFAGLFTLIFKSTLEKLAAGIFVFLGNDYNEDDIVILNGRPGRIVRVGITKTVFFLYEVKDGVVTGGTKLVIQNERLANMDIEKPLEKLKISKGKDGLTDSEDLI
jgi:hypothetical protein|tara:strand:- start:2463 stop:2846 length:384 start_codon:yes stop_codon:yes gene_type:complete